MLKRQNQLSPYVSARQLRPACVCSPATSFLIPATRVEADKLARSGLTEFLDRQIDLGQAEARDRQIEIPVEFSQFEETLTEQPLIPVGILRQPVVRDPQCLQLRRRQMPDLDNGDARHSELLGRQNAPMADDHVTLVVGHHGHHEAKLLDAIRELIDLTLRMLSRIAGIQQEVCDRPILNLDFNQPGVGRRVALSA